MRLAHSVEMFDHSVSSIVKLNASFVRRFLFFMAGIDLTNKVLISAFRLDMGYG